MLPKSPLLRPTTPVVPVPQNGSKTVPFAGHVGSSAAFTKPSNKIDLNSPSLTFRGGKRGQKYQFQFLKHQNNVRPLIW
jgi:hypothetical protein